MFVLIILMASGLVHLYINYSVLKESQEFLSEFTKENLENDVIHDFNWSFSLIELLEKNEIGYAKYLLYTSALYDSEAIKEKNISPKLESDLTKFLKQYQHMIKEQCNAYNLDACVDYGLVLEKQEDYDSAHDVLLKAAKMGSFKAMSALADLYRNKNWSKYSEEKAQEWTLKLGA